MPRVKKTDPCLRLETRVPESVLSAVQARLFSDVEGRVPFGAMSDLVTKLLRGWLSHEGTPNG